MTKEELEQPPTRSSEDQNLIDDIVDFLSLGRENMVTEEAEDLLKRASARSPTRSPTDQLWMNTNARYIAHIVTQLEARMEQKQSGSMAKTEDATVEQKTPPPQEQEEARGEPVTNSGEVDLLDRMEAGYSSLDFSSAGQSAPLETFTISHSEPEVFSCVAREEDCGAGGTTAIVREEAKGIAMHHVLAVSTTLALCVAREVDCGAGATASVVNEEAGVTRSQVETGNIFNCPFEGHSLHVEVVKGLCTGVLEDHGNSTGKEMDVVGVKEWRVLEPGICGAPEGEVQRIAKESAFCDHLEGIT